MTGGIQQHAPPVRGALFDGTSRSEAQRLRPIQIVHGQVEVHLLGTRGIGPRRWPIIRYLDGGQPSSLGLHRDELLTGERHLTAEKVTPERGKS
jgi:hypothetical protein